MSESPDQWLSVSKAQVVGALLTAMGTIAFVLYAVNYVPEKSAGHPPVITWLMLLQMVIVLPTYEIFGILGKNFEPIVYSDHLTGAHLNNSPQELVIPHIFAMVLINSLLAYLVIGTVCWLGKLAGKLLSKTLKR